jgi:nitrogen fixation/metabolism regulation signal transduction histidine kinase
LAIQRRIRRFFQRTLPVLSVLVLLFASLYLASDATRAVSGLSDYYEWVFGLTSVALLVLALAIGQQIVQLVRRLRAEAPGSRLTLRMVALFVALAVPPASIVYGFSARFLNNSIDSWFDVEVESGLDDALEITRSFLEFQQLSAQSQARQLAQRLADSSNARLRSELRDMLDETRAEELTVITRSGQVLATAARGLASLQPDLPPSFRLATAARSGSYVYVEPVVEGVMQIRVLSVLPEDRLGQNERILQAIYPVQQGFDEQADNVERQKDRYQHLAYLRPQLKRSFVLILSLVLMLSVLIAVLLAFSTARRLVTPISRLSEATRAIADGDYGRRLPVPGRDELGFLVSSFNTMTAEIDKASEAANASRVEAEQRRDYLEAVLGRLSSGVLSIDAGGHLLTANAAASQVLDVPLGEHLGENIDCLVDRWPFLLPLVQILADHRNDQGDWRHELTLEHHGVQQVLTCRGAPLPVTTGARAGQVLVFDDMTDLVRAQREAAWGEVARRLAHEVRNPLTPIQLAAERLRHKYLGQMEDDDAQVLDRATATIVSQVEALKTMVSAFSEYARAPTLQLEPSCLSELVDQVLELYQQSDQRLRVTTHWMNAEPLVFADRGRIRQLLHNLVKNAQEAVDGRPLELTVHNKLEWRDGQGWLRLTLADNGPGLPADILNKLFEPYATTKARGTGIGLAIVKKIAEEHGGDIHARNDESGGAVFVLRLPVDAAQVQESSPPDQRVG